MVYKYLKNLTKTSADFYVYGDIVDENAPDWFTGEKSATAVDTNAFKEEIDSLNGVTDFNIYINSGGGSVFASSAMVSMLKRFKQNTGAKIHAYIDVSDVQSCKVANIDWAGRIVYLGVDLSETSDNTSVAMVSVDAKTGTYYTPNTGNVAGIGENAEGETGDEQEESEGKEDGLQVPEESDENKR